MAVHALILVVDISGFSVWANQVAAIPAMEPLVEGLYTACTEAFPRAWSKGLGDGGLIVQEQDAPQSAGALQDLGTRLMVRVQEVTTAWRVHCLALSHHYGLSIALPLRWGITRGMVYPCTKRTDYLGAPINLAARLCDLARPSGMALDATTLPAAPEGEAQWRQIVVPVKSFGPSVPVWVSETVGALCS